MKPHKLILISAVIFAMSLVPTRLLANDGGNERVHFFQDITIGPDEQAAEAVCIVCSIHVQGSSGDTVAILGSIVVDGTISGDAVAVGGRIKLGEDAQVSGDIVGLGGGVVKHPTAVAKGQVVSEVGPMIFLGLVFAGIVVPLLPIVLFIWLIVWLLKRDRQVPVAPVPYRR